MIDSLCVVLHAVTLEQTFWQLVKDLGWTSLVKTSFGALLFGTMHCNVDASNVADLVRRHVTGRRILVVW